MVATGVNLGSSRGGLGRGATSVRAAQRCVENGIEPPGGASSLGLSPEDFERVDSIFEAKSKKKLEDKQKGKGEHPGGSSSEDANGEVEAGKSGGGTEDETKKAEEPTTGGAGNTTLMSLAAGALLIGVGLVSRRLFR